MCIPSLCDVVYSVSQRHNKTWPHSRVFPALLSVEFRSSLKITESENKSSSTKMFLTVKRHIHYLQILFQACTILQGHVLSCVQATTHFFYTGKKYFSSLLLCADGIGIAITTYMEQLQVKITCPHPVCWACYNSFQETDRLLMWRKGCSVYHNCNIRSRKNSWKESNITDWHRYSG